MLGMLHDRPEGKWVTKRDLLPFTYPDSRELRKLRMRSICLGSFVPWNVRRQTELIEKELDWEGDIVEGVAPGYEYEKIECSVQGIRDYLKFTKRGFGRTTHLANIDIRNGRLDRETGLELALEYDGKRPASLDRFLDYVGIDEDEFKQIADSQTVAPYKHDWDNVRNGNPLPDEAKFARSAPFPKTPLDNPSSKSE